MNYYIRPYILGQWAVYRPYAPNKAEKVYTGTRDDCEYYVELLEEIDNGWPTPFEYWQENNTI